MGMRNEILEQPSLAAGLLKTGLPLIAAIARAIQLRGIEFVVIAGRGTSDHASVYAQYIFGTRNDLPVALRSGDNQGPPSSTHLRTHSPLSGIATAA